MRELVQVGDAHARFKSPLELVDPLGSRLTQRAAERFQRLVGEPIVGKPWRSRPAGSSSLEGAQPLLERLLEGPADRHRFSHGFHLRGELRVGSAEFLECEPRTFHDDVVEHRLERRGRGPGYIVWDLVQPVAYCKLGPDARDRKSGSLRRQRGRSRDARIHLDHQHLAVLGIDRELDVASASLDSDLPNDGNGRVAHLLILAVRESHRRSDGNRVPGVNSHRVQILNRADDDDVVGSIPHDLELELLPTDNAALDQHLTRRRELEPPPHDSFVFIAVVGDSATGSAERKRGPDDRRKAHHVDEIQRFVVGRRDSTNRNGESDALHRRSEFSPVLRHPDCARVGADERHTVRREHTGVVQLHRDIEGRLAAHRWEERVWLFLFDDQLDELGRHRLEVCPVGELGIGHDRRRVGVHQDDLVALLLERLRSLSSGVIEFRALADDYRPGAFLRDSAPLRQKLLFIG